MMISLSWFRTWLTLWRNLNSMYYISTKLFLILCEYVLVCTCTQGLIKKLIFFVCVPSITQLSTVMHCIFNHLAQCVFFFVSGQKKKIFKKQKDFCVLYFTSWIYNQGLTILSLHNKFMYFIYLGWVYLLHFTNLSFVVQVVWEDVYNFLSLCLDHEVTCLWLSDLDLLRTHK